MTRPPSRRPRRPPKPGTHALFLWRGRRHLAVFDSSPIQRYLPSCQVTRKAHIHSTMAEREAAAASSATPATEEPALEEESTAIFKPVVELKEEVKTSTGTENEECIFKLYVRRSSALCEMSTWSWVDLCDCGLACRAGVFLVLLVQGIAACRDPPVTRSLSLEVPLSDLLASWAPPVVWMVPDV